MNRRNFLSLPLAAVALTALGRAAGPGAPGAKRIGRGYRVGAQKDRHDAALLAMGGRFDLKVSGEDTGGDLCIFDTVRWEKGGPPLHRHHAQDEWFYVIRGEFIVRVGDDTVKLSAGDSAFAPRRVPHAFANVSDGEAQMLVLFQPAGTMEDFFRAMSQLGKGVAGAIPARLWEEHGMELLGPPLKI